MKANIITTTTTIEDRFNLADAVPNSLLVNAIAYKKAPMLQLKEIYESGDEDTKNLVFYEDVIEQLLALENVELDVDHKDWGFFAGHSRIEIVFYREHKASWKFYDKDTKQWLFKKSVVLAGIQNLREIAEKKDAWREELIWRDLYNKVEEFDSSTLCD